MKSLLVLCLFSLVTLSMADTKAYHRGCIYILGRCAYPCPEGTHAYTTGCGRKLPESTCDQPKPELEEGMICDYSACYCDPPTVRDGKTKECVLPEHCSKNENTEDREERKIENQEEKEVDVQEEKHVEIQEEKKVEIQEEKKVENHEEHEVEKQEAEKKQ